MLYSDTQIAAAHLGQKSQMCNHSSVFVHIRDAVRFVEAAHAKHSAVDPEEVLFSEDEDEEIDNQGGHGVDMFSEIIGDSVCSLGASAKLLGTRSASNRFAKRVKMDAATPLKVDGQQDSTESVGSLPIYEFIDPGVVVLTLQYNCLI